MVTALTTAADGVGAGALSLLQAPQAPIEAFLATLLNDVNAISDDVVLVLDDYHVIEARDVQDGMAFLLEHLPPQVHLVIAGRPTLHCLWRGCEDVANSSRSARPISASRPLSPRRTSRG